VFAAGYAQAELICAALLLLGALVSLAGLRSTATSTGEERALS
jgi:hypothetical protein